MKRLIKRAATDRTHASIPFWSWNDKLEEGELRRQIAAMDEMGMRGFFMHARAGLGTEYMSQDWFDCVAACVDEAKQRGMEAWAYDENGWPSGFAGGKVLEDPKNHAAFIKADTVTEFPAPADDLLGVYVVTAEGVTRVTAPCDAADYMVIRRGTDFSYIDILNPAVTPQFIQATHQVYKERLGEEFGKAMPGFFTDEPQYYRWGTPWSDTLPAAFAARFGYDIFDGLPALFADYPGAEEFRYDYALLLHGSFIQHFIKPIYEWCEQNGVQLTGHAVEEWTLRQQMMCCGGVMPFYLYEHIPGIDYLGRRVQDISGVKQLGSVCEQAGKTYRLTETFACCGWDVSPLELKRIVDLQFAGGINMVCGHLYPYSERGQRKRDYPNHYSKHNPWYDYYKEFETHYAHLGSLLEQGTEQADTLVLHPIRSAYLWYKHDRPYDMTELETKFVELTQRLSYDQIPFHYGDETILRELGGVEGATLRVGRCRYDKVVIPYCHTLDGTTVAMLKEYLANGGKIHLYDGCPDRIDGRKADLSFLTSNTTYEELKAGSGVTVTREGNGVPLYLQIRRTEQGRILFLANPTGDIYPNVEITVKDCAGLTLLDPLSLQQQPLRGRKNSDGSVTVLVDFGDSDSCLLVELEGELLPCVPSVEPPALTLDRPFTLVGRPENMLLLDMAAVSLDGGPFSEVRPIIRIRDNLLAQRFEGEVSLRFPFAVEAAPKQLIFVAEPMAYRSVAVNGHPVTLTAENGRFDPRFVGADIAPYLHSGENEVTMTFAYRQSEQVYLALYGGGSESLRNCLAFDTEIEDAYLYGDFAVKATFREGEKPGTYRTDGPFVLTDRTDRIDMTDVVADGYPFFAGELTAETTLTHRVGDPTYLRLDGRSAVGRVWVNGTPVPGNLFSRAFELAPYLQEGENTIRVSLCFSNRNLLGPHHRNDPEPLDVYPTLFSFEKEWDGDTCPAFRPDYAFVKFGL